MCLDDKKTLKIRAANYGDTDDIKEITHEAFLGYQRISGAESLDALNETETDIENDIDTKFVFVAEYGGVSVGSVRIEILPDNTAYLTRFGVKENCQNRGIGKAILNFVDELMVKKGVRSICLHTSSKAAPMMRFYYGRGFYVKAIDNSRGYARALMEKEYFG